MSLFLQYVLAIFGMTAVGIIVWRLLQRQEQREKQSDRDHSDNDQSQ